MAGNTRGLNVVFCVAWASRSLRVCPGRYVVRGGCGGLRRRRRKRRGRGIGVGTWWGCREGGFEGEERQGKAMEMEVDLALALRDDGL